MRANRGLCCSVRLGKPRSSAISIGANVCSAGRLRSPAVLLLGIDGRGAVERRVGRGCAQVLHRFGAHALEVHVARFVLLHLPRHVQERPLHVVVDHYQKYKDERDIIFYLKNYYFVKEKTCRIFSLAIIKNF